MMEETRDTCGVQSRPNLRGLDDEQKTLAWAHWYTFLALNPRPDGWGSRGICWMLDLEERMQPETLHRLALARGAFWRNVNKEVPHG